MQTMTRTKINKLCDSMGLENILIPDGFESAFIGICTQFNNTFAIFDRNKCIKILMRQGMTNDEAEEYFEFNVQGAWLGSTTPGFVVFS